MTKVILNKNIESEYPGTGHLIACVGRQNVGDITDVYCRILSVGKYVDMYGTKVEVTKEMLTKLVDHHNKSAILNHSVEMQSKQEHSPNTNLLDNKVVDITQYEGLMNQLNHNAVDVEKTVGRVLGLMEVKYCNVIKNFSIFATLRVKHHHNVFMVLNDIWRYISCGFDLENLNFLEISWVTLGADPQAYKMQSYAISDTNKNNLQINLQNNSEHGIVANGYELLQRMKKELYINKSLLRLCKERKIYKADTYELREYLMKLDNEENAKIAVQMLATLLQPKVNEVFYELSQSTMNNIGNELISRTKNISYKTK